MVLKFFLHSKHLARLVFFLMDVSWLWHWGQTNRKGPWQVVLGAIKRVSISLSMGIWFRNQRRWSADIRDGFIHVFFEAIVPWCGLSHSDAVIGPEGHPTYFWYRTGNTSPDSRDWWWWLWVYPPDNVLPSAWKRRWTVRRLMLDSRAHQVMLRST